MIASLFDPRSCSAAVVLTRLARQGQNPPTWVRLGLQDERALSPMLWSKGDRVPFTDAVASVGVRGRAGSPLRERVRLGGRAATGRGLPLPPEIRPIARRRLAYQATVGDVNPHAQGSRDPPRLRRDRRLCGARIRCGALVASSARRQEGWSAPACHAATPLRAVRPSSVRDPTSEPAREPLHGAREVEEVWCAQRRASPPHLPTPGFGAEPTPFGCGPGLTVFRYAVRVTACGFDSLVGALEHDYAPAVGPAAAGLAC